MSRVGFELLNEDEAGTDSSVCQCRLKEWVEKLFVGCHRGLMCGQWLGEYQ